MQEPISRLADLPATTDLQAQLITAIEDLIEAYEGVVAGTPGAAEATVSAGPFASMEAVRAFERQLAGLAGVRAVEVRSYEGEDRVVLHVELEPRL